MSSASAPTPKVAAVFVCCVLLLLNVALPAAAGVTKCSDYCRAKCSLDCKDRSVVSVCSSTICRIAPEICDDCRAGVLLGACLGACYGICTDDCI